MAGRDSGRVRRDGRPIHNIPALERILPYLMRRRSESARSFRESVEVTEAERWLNAVRGEYEGMSLLHLILAAYIRVVAAIPAINRFVAGRRIHSRNGIEVALSVRRRFGLDSDRAVIKVIFSPADTVFDVYAKVQSAVSALEGNDESTESYVPIGIYDKHLHRFSKRPRILRVLWQWVLKLLDYFGLFPERTRSVSPYHASLRIVDTYSNAIGPVDCALPDFGTLSSMLSYGARRSVYELNAQGEVVLNRYVDMCMSFDGRISDVSAFAEAVRLMIGYLEEPYLLESPPANIRNDAY